jgi:hypothetical protein
MNLWLNCLSATPELLSVLDPQPVAIFSTVDNRQVGRTIRYEVRNEIDLWALCEIDDTAQRFERAAGILAQGLRAGFQKPKLVSMLVTNLSRDELRNLNL